jgi:hypothetical protein
MRKLIHLLGPGALGRRGNGVFCLLLAAWPWLGTFVLPFPFISLSSQTASHKKLHQFHLLLLAL